MLIARANGDLSYSPTAPLWAFYSQRLALSTGGRSRSGGPRIPDRRWGPLPGTSRDREGRGDGPTNRATGQRAVAPVAQLGERTPGSIPVSAKVR